MLTMAEFLEQLPTAASRETVIPAQAGIHYLVHPVDRCRKFGQPKSWRDRW
jgi:hypothetical protein